MEPIGLHDEIIMDYSTHDAIEAGFNKVIFVIWVDIERVFHECIGNRVEKICSSELCLLFCGSLAFPGLMSTDGLVPLNRCAAFLKVHAFQNHIFPKTLLLLVGWYSGIVSRHCLKHIHNSVVKCQHLSKHKRGLGVKCLHLAILIMRQMVVKY